MSWADDLPRIRAENQAWRDEHLPRLRERTAYQQAARERCKAILDRALAAAGTTPDEMRLVAQLTGFNLHIHEAKS